MFGVSSRLFCVAVLVLLYMYVPVVVSVVSVSVSLCADDASRACVCRYVPCVCHSPARAVQRVRFCCRWRVLCLEAGKCVTVVFPVIFRCVIRCRAGALVARIVAMIAAVHSRSAALHFFVAVSLLLSLLLSFPVVLVHNSLLFDAR